MLSYVIRRLGLGIGVMLAVSLVTYALTNTAVDPARAIAGEAATEQDVQAIRVAYGFNRPIVERYGIWLVGAATGDLGTSYRQKRPVIAVIAERLPVTLK